MTQSIQGFHVLAWVPQKTEPQAKTNALFHVRWLFPAVAGMWETENKAGKEKNQIQVDITKPATA